MEMWWSQLWSQFKQLQIVIANSSLKKIQGLNGILTNGHSISAAVLWPTKTHMSVGSHQFIDFIFTPDRNETRNEVNLNCGNTDEMEMWSSKL